LISLSALSHNYVDISYVLYDATEDADKKEAEAAGEKVSALVCEQVEQVLASNGHEVKRLSRICLYEKCKENCDSGFQVA
jgi:hypothetical protein